MRPTLFPARNTLYAWLARLCLPVFGLVFLVMMGIWLYWVLGYGPVQLVRIRETMGRAVLIGAIYWTAISTPLWLLASLLAWCLRAIYIRTNTHNAHGGEPRR